MADDPILKAIQGAAAGVAEDESADPIMSAITGAASAKSKSARASSEPFVQPQPIGGPISEQAKKIGRPMISLEPSAQDTSKTPLNVFTNLPAEPGIPTEEEKAAHGTISPREVGVGERVERMLGAGAPEGSFAAQVTGQRGTKGEPRLLSPEQLMTEREQAEHPILTGAGEFAGGLTTPSSVALLAGTGGAGQLAGPSGQAIKQLLAAGFTAQMLTQAVQQAPEVAAAIRRGDTFNAKRLLTHMALGAAMAGAAAHGTFEEGLPTELEPGTVSGPLAMDQVGANASRRFNDFKANNAARAGVSGLAAAEQGVEQAKQARINAPVEIPRTFNPEEQPKIVQGRPAGPEQNPLTTEAAKVREEQGNRAASSPEKPVRVIDKRRVGAGESLAPESPATLRKQTDALAAGTNKIVYFPKGQESLPAPPDNAQVTVVPGDKPGAGTYYHTSDFTPEQIKASVEDGSYSKLLGFPQSKEDAMASGAPHGVVARDADGTELKAGLVDAKNPQAIAEQAATLARQFPDAKIGVETPEHVITSRGNTEAAPEKNAAPQAASRETPAQENPSSTLPTEPPKFNSEKAAFLNHSSANRQQMIDAFNTDKQRLEASRRTAKTDEERKLVDQRIADIDENLQSLTKEKPLQKFTQRMPEEAPETAPTPKLEKYKGEKYGQQQAQLYANRNRNPIEREYAQSYLKARVEGSSLPERSASLDASTARTLRDGVDRMLTRKSPPSLEQRYPATTLAEARGELLAAHELASSFERPGRYFAENEGGVKTKGGNTRGSGGWGTWYGIGSSRHIVAEQFPWYAEISQGADRLGALIKKGKGAEYNRLLQTVAEHIEREKQSAAPVIGEFAPKLRELSDRIDGNDQELSDSLAEMAAGDGRGIKNLRQYITERITDAERADSFFNAIDDAAAEARQASAPQAPAAHSEVRPGAREGAGEQGTETVASAFSARSERRSAETSEATETPNLAAAPEDLSKGLDKFSVGDRVRPAAGPLKGKSLEITKVGATGVYAREGDGPVKFLRTGEFAPAENPPATGKEPGIRYSGVPVREMLEGARVVQRAWEDKFAKPFIDRVLKIGDKYRKAREADPAVAEGLHLLDNAPTYLRAKAEQVVRNIVGDLSRPQERLFTLMADAESRENLRANHPGEYAEAQKDPAIQDALRKYRPVEQELTHMRAKMGGQTIEQDYLRRVYDKYVAGVNKATAPGTSERGTSAFDRVIRPQRTDKLTREATPEYHYQNGLHELGPAFATKFIGTHLKALRDQVAKEFIAKATFLKTGASEPRFIDYGGQRYYRQDVGRDLREAGAKDVKTYSVYDPTAGEKFPVPSDGKYLGPRELVKALTDFGKREDSEPGAIRRFFQEQILGFGFGVPHIANIMRRVSQSVPGGAINPQGWARAWKVALSKELRDRGISGLNDPTFDMLAKHGAISTGEVSNLKAYVGGNLNPANWARSMAQVGHKFLFEPTSAKGFGGLDQRARLYVADLVKSQRPDLSDADVARAVRDQLGDYNRANWSDRQHMLAKFMMFPGWDASSIRWVLQHPIKTAVPPALMVLLANRALHAFGQNRDEDKYDISNIHVGDRAYGTSLLRESVARNLFRPLLEFAQSKVRGESNQRAFDAASHGITAGAGGLLNMLRPDLSGFLALAANRQGLFTGKEIVSKGDYLQPGKILPSRALEKQASFTLRRAIPALDRMLGSDEAVDWKGFVGGNLGTPNFKDDAENRLFRNNAEASRVYQTISRLAKTKPDQAREMLKDPDNAAFALFHGDLQRITKGLRKIDEVRAAVEASNASDEEKQQRVQALEKFRTAVLGHADALNSLLFKRRMAGRPASKTPSSTVTGLPMTLPESAHP